MGNVFLHGKGGGGSTGGSELTIVGATTRPAKPTQNTIWVDTDVEITDYVLSATEPENHVDGMVWITIGNSGITKVASPIGGDWITVCPLSAKQYVNGTWVLVDAMLYQYGEWLSVSTYLYHKGNECTILTGGWESKAWYVWGSSYAAVAPTLTKNSTNMTASITMKKSSPSGITSGAVHILKDFDFTDKKTVTVDLSRVVCAHADSTYKLYVGVYILPRTATSYDDSNKVASSTVEFTKAEIRNNVSLVADVTTVTGKYDVAIGMHHQLLDITEATHTIVIDSVRVD